MNVTDFNFELPPELIAQDPLEDRSSSRLLVLDKKTGATSHHIFREIKDYLKPGDCLVINDTKVIPARLIGEKEGTGGKVEVLLLKRKGNDVWETLVKPGKKMKPGARVSFGDGLLKGEVLEVVEEGNRLIHFEYEGSIMTEFLKRFWISLDRCRFRLTSPTSWRTRIVTRLCMQSIPDLRLLRRQDCILHRSFWKKSKQKVWRLRM